MKSAITFSLLLVAAALTFDPARAWAQCDPGVVFCAQVEIGGQIQIGTPPPPPAPPPPAVVYVQPAPPPPPVVIYRPAPPPQPVVVYQQEVYQETQVVWMEGDGRWGLHGSLGGTVSDSIAMGGGMVALRYRPRPRFALDLGVGGYAGYDYQGNERVEVPLTADFLFFFNPRHRLQLYGVAGVGVSFAEVGGDAWHDHSRDGAWDGHADDGVGMSYYGGQLGFGLEWRLGQHWALNADLRGFVRHRFASETNTPEFVEIGADGRPTGRATDTSGGALLNVGATLYF